MDNWSHNKQFVQLYWKVHGSVAKPLFCVLLSWKKPLKWISNSTKPAQSVNICNTFKQNPSGAPSWPAGVRVAKAWAPFVHGCAFERNFYMLLHSAHSPFASFQLRQSVFLEQSLVSAGPSHPCTRWPSTRFFHPVGSCTHLFSTSKTQGLFGVMIGFRLCNLLEFCLTSAMASS